MTATAEQVGTRNPDGVIFLPGFPGGIDVSGNPERELSCLEFAIITGRQPFEHLRRDMDATVEAHEVFVEERNRILGVRALASQAEV